MIYSEYRVEVRSPDSREWDEYNNWDTHKDEAIKQAKELVPEYGVDNIRVVLMTEVEVPFCIKYSKPNSKYGDLFTKAEFQEMVKDGCINSFDGSGSYSNGTHQAQGYADIYEIPEEVTHILWFNK